MSFDFIAPNLAFQSFDFDPTWWRLFQKCVARTKFDIWVFKQNLDKDDDITVNYIPYSWINIRYIFWCDFSKVHSVYCTSYKLIGQGLEILYIINIFLFNLISVSKEWKLILYLHFNRVVLSVFIVTLCSFSSIFWPIDLFGWVGCDVYHHFQQYFSYIVAVSFIGRGNQITWKKTHTCRKSLTNFMT